MVLNSGGISVSLSETEMDLLKIESSFCSFLFLLGWDTRMLNTSRSSNQTARSSTGQPKSKQKTSPIDGRSTNGMALRNQSKVYNNKIAIIVRRDPSPQVPAKSDYLVMLRAAAEDPPSVIKSPSRVIMLRHLTTMKWKKTIWIAKPHPSDSQPPLATAVEFDKQTNWRVSTL
jgi:hypothetical protein